MFLILTKEFENDFQNENSNYPKKKETRLITMRSKPDYVEFDLL